MSIPRVGSKHSMMRVPAAIHRAMVTFCWLPPESLCTSRCARVSICRRRDRVVDAGVLPPRMSTGPRPGRRALKGKCDVLPHRALHQERLGAIARHVGHAGVDGVRGMAELDTLAVDLDRAAGRAARPGQRGEQLVLALSLQGHDAEDLARVEVERNVTELGSDLQSLRPAGEGGLGSRADAGWPRLRQSCALSMRAPSISSTIFSSAPGAISTTPTVSPSLSTVARWQSAEISSRRCEMKMMDRPGLALPPHDVDDPVGEIRGQRGGHLVEQEHIGLDRQRAGEIEHAQDRQRNAPCGLARGRGR